MMHLYFKEVNTNKMYNQTVCVMVVNILLCTPSQLDLLRKKKLGSTKVRTSFHVYLLLTA